MVGVGSGDRLGQFISPTLDANGADRRDDPHLPQPGDRPERARRRAPSLPRAGHGFLFQDARRFAADMIEFLA
jgi:hypothetical protein